MAEVGVNSTRNGFIDYDKGLKALYVKYQLMPGHLHAGTAFPVSEFRIPEPLVAILVQHQYPFPSFYVQEQSNL
jgi:hypothetical protein